MSRLAAGLSGTVPRGHGAGLRQSWRFGLRAGRQGCMLQHECPLARAGRRRGGWVHDRDDREDLPAVLLCLDADAVAADLAAGTLACPSCGTGRLAPWGYGRERPVRLRGGRTTRLRPRRARCRSCRRTRILLPSWCAPRRADGIEVIGTAAGLAMAGHGHRPVAAALGVPAGTAAPPARQCRVAARARHRRAGRPRLLPPGTAVGARGLAAGRRAERPSRRRGLRPAQLRALAGDDLAAGRPARPGPLRHARPRQLITCRRSRAPPCPQPRRRRSPRPAAPRAATP